MKPRSNHSELPATEVIASPIHPPVHDSALASNSPLRLSVRPTLSANRYSSESTWSSQHTHQQYGARQTQHGDERRCKIVHHHPEAAVEARLDMADRPRLHRIEEAEQCEGSALPQQSVRREEQHEQERDDLVPHDRFVIFDAERTSGGAANIDSEDVQRYN